MRVYQHIIDTKAVKATMQAIPDYWVIRELTERDYGIDLMLEIFKEVGQNRLGHTNYDSSGHVCYLQVKGTDSALVINPDDTINFSLDKNSLLYVEKFTTPFLLVRVSTKTNEIYFVWLQRYIMEVLDDSHPTWRESSQKTFAIKIPITNKLPNEIKKVELIASRIKYIEEHSEFVERFGSIANYFGQSENCNFDDEHYKYFIKELTRIKRLSTLLGSKVEFIDEKCIDDLIDFVKQVRDGKLKKSDLKKYPHKFNFEIILNEGSYRIENETFVADNDQSTVY